MYTMQEKPQSTCHTFFTLDPRKVSDHTSHMVYVGNLSLVSMRTKHAPTLGRSLDDQRQTEGLEKATRGMVNMIQLKNPR
jgi:hypothetical protein